MIRCGRRLDEFESSRHGTIQWSVLSYGQGRHAGMFCKTKENGKQGYEENNGKASGNLARERVARSARTMAFIT